MPAFSISRSKPLVAILTALTMGSVAAHAQTAPRSAPTAPAFAACPDSTTVAAEINTPCLAIVDFEDDVAPANRQGILRGAGAVMRFGFGVMNATAAMVPNVDAYWSLALDPAVTRLYPDLPVHAIAPPGSCTPWPECKGSSTEEPAAETLGAGVMRIGADFVWPDHTGAGAVVAILDTGLDSNHADLAGNIGGGANCLGDSAAHACDDSPGSWEDDAGHGTHVGGIVAALQGNDLDVAGVAPGATLYAVKVLDGSGSGYMSNVIAGLEWTALNTPARVVNMSLGGAGRCGDEAAAPIRAAIESVLDAGVSVVVAAGNNRAVEVVDVIPAGCPGVIAVASTSAENGNNKCKRLSGNIRADTASFFTTDGPGVAVSAPGEAREDNNCAMIQPVGILSLAMGGGTTRMYGTSMAAPHVTGVVALMLEANPGLSPAQVNTAIRKSVSLIGEAPLPHPYFATYDDGIYEGVVDARGAVARALAAP